MATMPRGGLERVLRPPAYEGSEPESAYAYDLTDYLGTISVEVDAVGQFAGEVVGSAAEARLPIRINAIGAFSGRTEIDMEDRDDYFDEPRPHSGIYFLEQDPPTHAKLPFAEKPGVVHPDNDSLEAYYRVARGIRSWIEIVATKDRVPGHNLELRGGVIEVKGTLDIPSSPELTADIATGYISPDVKIGLHAPAAQEAGGKAVEMMPGFSSPFPVLMERVYSPEPRWLDRPYNPYRHTM